MGNQLTKQKRTVRSTRHKMLIRRNSAAAIARASLTAPSASPFALWQQYLDLRHSEEPDQETVPPRAATSSGRRDVTQRTASANRWRNFHSTPCTASSYSSSEETGLNFEEYLEIAQSSQQHGCTTAKVHKRQSVETASIAVALFGRRTPSQPGARHFHSTSEETGLSFEEYLEIAQQPQQQRISGRNAAGISGRNAAGEGQQE